MKILFWSLLAFALNVGSSSLASTYLYLIDTSTSMRANRTGLIDAVVKDLERAVGTETYRAGDQIYVWTFNSKVSELKKYSFDPSSPQNLGIPIQAELKRIKLEGTTSIAKPLVKAFSEFGPTESGNLTIFLYTDGREVVAKKDAENILRLGRQYYNESRLLRVHLVYFTQQELPKETRRLIASLGGSMMVAEPPSPKIATPPSPKIAAPTPAMEKKEPKPDPVITVSPTNIQFLNQAAPEVIKTVPVEFKLPAGQSNLLVDLRVSTTNWPAEMSLSATTDRLTTDGKQSIPLLLKNAPPGRYGAVLKLSSSVRVEPSEIPIDIEILAPKPSEIGLRLFPDKPGRIVLPADGAWHALGGVGLTLFYPERFRDVRIRFDCDAPKGVLVQLVSGSEPAKGIDPGTPVRLAELGESAMFRARQTESEVIGKDVSARVGIRFAAEQNLLLSGARNLEIPLRFELPLEVRVETREIILNELAPDAQTTKANLEIRVKGEPTGQQFRVTKQGAALAGVSVTPSEIQLKPGVMSVELELSGWAGRSAGPIEGSLVLTPSGNSATSSFKEAVIPVRGKIGEPPKLLAEVENPFVAGKPIIIHARLDGAAKGSIRALVRSPASLKENEIVLTDSGLAEDGDVKAGDEIYSGVFKRTEELGKYQITIAGNSSKGRVANVALVAPIYFKTSATPLVGNITQRKKDDFVELKAVITSEYPSDMSLTVEGMTTKLPVENYLSNKTLKAGSNTMDLLVRLLPEAHAHQYKYEMVLLTEPIGGIRARIPLLLEIKVTSFFHYFIRLVGVALGLAVIACLAFLRPWKRAAAVEPEFVSRVGHQNPDAQ